MDELIKLGDIYDKNLNFLVGSGASFGLLPTLALKLKDAQNNEYTIETLAVALGENDQRYAALFMHYYSTCIRPAQDLTLASIQADPLKADVLNNYRLFVRTVLQLLLRRRPLDKRCNIFTTNYDGCFALVSDILLQEGSIDFVLNDGARGFLRRNLQVRNFNTYFYQTGIFERHQSSIPQINLVQMHGSVYWEKQGPQIFIDYSPPSEDLLDKVTREALQPFSECLLNAKATIVDLVAPTFNDGRLKAFMESYKRLPVVNPTKWKFHETVFEEHYYQMLRMLSYELERPNAVLITFGFSFADEHILNLIKRSLSNPQLQVYVCCFDAAERERLSQEFQGFRNVRCISLDEGVMDFAAFNAQVLAQDVSDTESVKDSVATPAEL